MKLSLSAASESAVRDFFIHDCKIQPRFIHKKLHVTLYHAPLQLRNLTKIEETVDIVVDILETRFMVMAAGGENPRPNIDPGRCTVGLRVTRRNVAFESILSLRRRIYPFENDTKLRDHRPTGDRRNAFGAKQFQPHLSLIRPGSGIGRDLTPYGIAFRSKLVDLRFDEFSVAIH